MHRSKSVFIIALAICQMIVLIAFVSVATSSAVARDARTGTAGINAARVAREPCTMLRTHRAGRMGLSVTNQGVLGSQGGGVTDPCTGERASSLQFPAGSGAEYLFQSALWVGVIRAPDTLVSVGQDGWSNTPEMYPAVCPDGEIVERTNRMVIRQDSGSACYDVWFSSKARSEHDLIANYSDSFAVGVHVYEHIPLPVGVNQTSYSWAVPPADQIIIVEYTIKNVKATPLDQLYFGFFVDPDVGSVDGGDIYSDDYSGFVGASEALIPGAPLDSIALAWGADNDGDPNGPYFDAGSVTGALGVRLLPDQQSGSTTTFNWWAANGNPQRDWGPNLRSTSVTFPEGNLGTPVRDFQKYGIMANGEQDYDQPLAYLDHSLDGWYPPAAGSGVADDIASGADTRFLLSRGPFDLPPGSEITIPAAIVVGTDFHKDPGNFAANFESWDPYPYMAGLDFSNLIWTSQIAEWIYDTPGIDTDGDGYRGRFIVHDFDTTFFEGDGVADLIVPAPPELVLPHGETDVVLVRLRFNGEASETTPDRFSQEIDFEGYEVYLSTTGTDDADFALMARRDITNYTRYRWDFGRSEWSNEDLPLTLQALRILYDSLTLADYGFMFHPDSFVTPDPAQSFRAITPWRSNPSILDTNFFYFAPFGANDTPDDAALAFRADSLGETVTDVIRKVYPWARPQDIAYRDDGTSFRPYYEYEYQFDASGLAGPLYFTVATHDQGFPLLGVEPLHSPLPGRIIEASPNVCPVEITGDANESGEVSLGDIIYTVSYVFKHGPEPMPCLAAADVDCTGTLDPADVIYLVNYMLKGGPAPCDVCAIIPNKWECP